MSFNYGLPGSSKLAQPVWNLNESNINDGGGETGDCACKHPARSNFTVEDLSYSFICSELAPILDQNTTCNVLVLSRAMKFQKDSIAYLEKCFYRDGAWASDFLATLVAEKPDVTIYALKQCLNQEGVPKEAVDTIASYDDVDIIDDILPLHLDELASKLTTRESTELGWEFVAKSFGYEEQIHSFKSLQLNFESPTMELINLIKTQRPGMRVVEVIHLLKLINNNDAVKALEAQLPKI